MIGAVGVLTAATIVTGVVNHSAASSVIGAGSLPVSFNLTDNQGSWFDTGTALFGNQSLAVAELPRVSTDSIALPGLSTVASTTSALLNNDLVNTTKAKLLNLPATGPKATSIGGTGVSVDKLLQLDRLSAAVHRAVPAGDPRAAQADTLIHQLSTALAGRPLSQPVNLASIPSGAQLMSLLAQLRATDVASVPVTVNFNISAPNTAAAHTVTSLIWPEGANTIDQNSATVGNLTLTLNKPGLYAFACKIHPYMLGAIVVDDPLTPGLDFGQKLQINSRAMDVPSSADIVQQLVQKFFTITTGANWERYSATGPSSWDPTYPPAPILTYDASGAPQLIPLLDSFYQSKFHEPHALPAANVTPATPGVGEVWVDTQMEKTAGKVKSGTATKINAATWQVERKVALPSINLNNPHNMWTDRKYKYIYQTEWFSNRLTVFDRKTGAYIRSIEVGPDPSHVMTRTTDDQLHVAINAGNAVVVLAPGATKITGRILMQGPGEKIAHPHAHWMSADGHTMVTPNVNSNDSTVTNLVTGKIHKESTGQLPIATGMMPDSSKYYAANFLGQSVSCISLKKNACHVGKSKVHNKTIDLWAGYDPINGSGPAGGLPIQLPVSPDGNSLLVANTLSSKLTVINTHTDEVVKTLPCDAGCHGINFGLKKGGGYYAYVSSKFANTMSIVDMDPNGDGNPADAAVVGKITLDATPGTAMDDQIVDYSGMGGQGVLALPIAYNGWSAQVPKIAEFKAMTCKQRYPLGPKKKWKKC